jgi:hypothetical protein
MTCDLSRLLCGGPTRKMDLPTRVAANQIQSLFRGAFK